VRSVPSKSGVQIAATMSLKFLLETQMVILMLCNSVLMRLLTTSALSFSVSFDCELHPLYSARPREHITH